MPKEVLTGCTSLITLQLHGNPVTIEQLRVSPGWKEFDERRKKKHDKQVDMKVLSHFDEGADFVAFEHWSI